MGRSPTERAGGRDSRAATASTSEATRHLEASDCRVDGCVPRSGREDAAPQKGRVGRDSRAAAASTSEATRHLKTTPLASVPAPRDRGVGRSPTERAGGRDSRAAGASTSEATPHLEVSDHRLDGCVPRSGREGAAPTKKGLRAGSPPAGASTSPRPRATPRQQPPPQRRALPRSGRGDAAPTEKGGWVGSPPGGRSTLRGANRGYPLRTTTTPANSIPTPATRTSVTCCGSAPNAPR